MVDFTLAQRRGVTNTPAHKSEPLVDPREPPETDQLDLTGSRVLEGVYFERSARTGSGVDLSAAEVLDGPWTIPGRGVVGDRCGVVAPNGFCDGEDSHVTFGRHDCGRRSCPRCWFSGWRNPRVVDAVSRLAVARQAESDGIDRRATHVSVSPPEPAEIRTTDEFYEARSKAIDIAKEAGVRGGLIIPHGYRIKEEIKDLIARKREEGEFSGGDWKWVREHDVPWYEFVYWSPHFHVVGLARDVDGDVVEEIEERNGWTVHNIKRKRADGKKKHSLAPFRLTYEAGYKDMAGVVGYTLSHPTFESEAGRSVITWFGDLATSNFQPDPTNEESALDAPVSEGTWRAIRRMTRKAVGAHGDEYGEGGEGDDEEEERECPHDGCDGTWHPIWEAKEYLDQRGSQLSTEAYDRIHTAYLWSQGDIQPPPGAKRPKTEEEARESFSLLLSDD